MYFLASTAFFGSLVISLILHLEICSSAQLPKTTIPSETLSSSNGEDIDLGTSPSTEVPIDTATPEKPNSSNGTKANDLRESPLIGVDNSTIIPVDEIVSNLDQLRSAIVERTKAPSENQDSSIDTKKSHVGASSSTKIPNTTASPKLQRSSFGTRAGNFGKSSSTKIPNTTASPKLQRSSFGTRAGNFGKSSSTKIPNTTASPKLQRSSFGTRAGNFGKSSSTKTPKITESPTKQRNSIGTQSNNGKTLSTKGPNASGRPKTPNTSMGQKANNFFKSNVVQESINLAGDVISQKTFGGAMKKLVSGSAQIAVNVISTSYWPIGPLIGGGLNMIFSAFKITDDSERQAEEEAARKAAEDEAKREAEAEAAREAQSEADREAQAEANRFNHEAFENITNELSEIHDDISSLRLDIKDLSAQLGVLEENLLKEMQNMEILVVSESQRVIDELTKLVKTGPFIIQMREKLEEIDGDYDRRITCVLDYNCKGDKKDYIIQEMMNEFSEYRKLLRSFISKFIKPTQTEGIFDMQKKMREEEKDGCRSVSYHTQDFKTYMYISKALTDGYSLVAATHAIRHEYYIRSKKFSESSTCRDSSVLIVTEFLDGMRTLMEVTRLALDESSREIRQCAPKLKDEETFHSFGLHNNLLNPTVWHSLEKCRGYPPPEYSDGINPIPLTDELNGDEPDVYENQVMHCSGYNDAEKIIFSTHFVEARPNYVITGIRWRFRDGVLYLDIQEGKFKDGTQTVSGTVEWIETPKNDEEVMVLYYYRRDLLLDDFILPPNHYVTGVQMIRNDEKRISLRVSGVEAINNGAKLSNATIYADGMYGDESEELPVDFTDPKEAPSDLKPKVMRTEKSFHVSFRPIQESQRLLNDDENTNEQVNEQAVPYLNMQEVFTYPPSPIGGIGIYHEAVRGYAGFVGLRLISPEFNTMIDMEKFAAYREMFQLEERKQKSKAYKETHGKSKKDRN